jgi:hypothetical protein
VSPIPSSEGRGSHQGPSTPARPPVGLAGRAVPVGPGRLGEAAQVSSGSAEPARQVGHAEPCQDLTRNDLVGRLRRPDAAILDVRGVVPFGVSAVASAVVSAVAGLDARLLAQVRAASAEQPRSEATPRARDPIGVLL